MPSPGSEKPRRATPGPQAGPSGRWQVEKTLRRAIDPSVGGASRSGLRRTGHWAGTQGRGGSAQGLGLLPASPRRG